MADCGCGTAGFVVAQGDTTTVTLTFPTTVDITGYTILFTVKKFLDDDPTDGNAVVAETATIVDTHTATVTFDATMPAGTFSWDAKLISPTGDESHTTVGKMIVRDVVTNRG